jgi:hypothetical protein
MRVHWPVLRRSRWKTARETAPLGCHLPCRHGLSCCLEVSQARMLGSQTAMAVELSEPTMWRARALLGGPFWLIFTYVTSVLVKKY